MIREAPDLEWYTRQSNCSNLICHSGRAWHVSAAALSDMTASQMRLHTTHSVIEPLTLLPLPKASLALINRHASTVGEGGSYI